MQPFYENKHSNFNTWHKESLTFPLHLHSQIELIYVLRGSITIKLHETSHELYEGDFIIIFPNVIHGYDSTNKANKIITSIFDISLCGSFINMINQNQPINPIIRKEDVHKDILYSLESLRYANRHKEEQIIVESYIQLIFARSFPCLNFSAQSNKDYDNLTYKIALYISKNYTKPISLDTLSSELCVCKYHISHVFSKKFGSSFNDYINNMRIKMAVYLLDTTDKPIIDIWNDCGFESQRTFNRVFKKDYLITPSQYRKNNKKL